MDNEKISLLIDKVNDAELVLVGIGEEYELSYEELKNKGKEAETRKAFYQEIAKLLNGKNYFVVSLCTDGLIRASGLDNDRIVEPCGNYRYLQCSEKCTTDLYESERGLTVCPKCGKPLLFNRITDAGAQYVEEGYLEQWGKYTKWLQGTVNRKVCILELGVGMQFPSVIRFPFEKIAFYNQKASFVRIHSRLYQVTEEIKEKSYGIQASLQELLKELSNVL